MILTFCGHTQFLKTVECEHKIVALLSEKIGDAPADIFLGGYGNFDFFAYDCCKKYKETHPNINLVLVTPYISDNYLKQQGKKYDLILYPEIGDKPKRYAIVYRNRFMIEKADFVIAYVSHNWGGAYTMYRYGKRMGKMIYNLADFKE